MISVYLLREKDEGLVGFEIGGHADSDAYGKDIVCSSVSSVAYMVVNTITDIISVHADVKIFSSGSMYLRIKKNDARRCSDILLGFEMHILSLEEQYSENILVNYLEV